MNARPPAVAGSFYPADPPRLRTTVQGLLAAAAADAAAPGMDMQPPKALIVPHAALRFSGAVAARAYGRLAAGAHRIRRVVMLGPAHRLPVRGLGIPSAEAFLTPLGSVPLDREYLDVLGAQPCTEIADEAHGPEHCLEVQLPLLQQVLGEFRLTPVVVGGAGEDAVAVALGRVWGGPETLVVISSDLSHYHPYDDAQRRDTATSLSIMTLAAGRLRSKDACGWRAVNGLLRHAGRTGLSPATLDVLNSGDTRGGRDRVVGYGAWQFGGSVDDTPADLDRESRRQLLRVALANVRAAAAGKNPPAVATGTFPRGIQLPGAAFVTLTRQGRLRGCLGTLQAYRPLVLDVAERAWSAACRDPRFKPVTEPELPGMRLDISVLTPRRPLAFDDEADLLRQLHPGTDGLVIRDGDRQATFLPKVWEEIRRPADFLARLKQKAGLDRRHWSENFRAWRYGTVTFGAGFPAGTGTRTSPPP